MGKATYCAMGLQVLLLFLLAQQAPPGEGKDYVMNGKPVRINFFLIKAKRCAMESVDKFWNDILEKFLHLMLC